MRHFIILFFALLSCLSISVVSAFGQKTDRSLTIDKAFKPYPGGIHFFLFGDFGRDGKAGQTKVSEVMSAASKIDAPQFIVSTGDNFYPDGVKSTEDKQWKSSFEQIYTGQGLQCPWYVVLGNHDYHKNPQAEVDYSKVSTRWNMPSRYYLKSFPLDDKSSSFADFLFIDTSPLDDDYYKEKYSGNIISQDTTRQLQWIDSVLTVSKATWKFVIGHHSMYSGGKRVGDVSYARKHLEKIFRKHDVDAYMCGHEHDLQYIKPEGNTHYLVSGAGSEVRPTGKLPATRFAAAVNGFMALSVTPAALFIDVIDVEGKVIYHSQIDKDTKK